MRVALEYVAMTTDPYLKGFKTFKSSINATKKRGDDLLPPLSLLKPHA